MNGVWFGCGLAVLVATLADAFLTVLQPSLRGPLSTRLNRLIWSGVRAVGMRRRRVLTFAGPVAVLADVMLWVGGLVVGFGLMYVPFLDDFAFARDVPFGDRGVVEALYASGVIAITIGLGDVIGATDALRLVTMLEGGFGAALLTLTLSYIMGVYPIVIEQRVTAMRFSDLELQDPRHVAHLLDARGLAPIESLHENVIRTNAHLRRFPVLYYFHPREERESTYALLRGAAMTCAVLRWAADEGSTPGAERYGRAMQAALDRTISDYVSGFIRGLGSEASEDDLTDAEDRLRRLCSITGADSASAGDASSFGRWSTGVERFLRDLARAHGYEPRDLLAGPAAAARA